MGRLILVLGGSGSGKSDYAESLFELSSMEQKIYLATMQIFDHETRAKVDRHVMRRKGKGFRTLEQPVNIQEAVDKVPNGAWILLECLSNLTANEMFQEDTPQEAEWIVEHVFKGVCQLKEKSDALIVVSNNLFEDGIVYEESTQTYLDVLGQLNSRIGKIADQVVEVVCGIPVSLTEGEAKK